MFRKEPVARQQHCEALVKQCAELGAEILDCAAAVLAPGGQLVYSTCTFAPEEDEGQVAAFLQRHPEFTLADALGNVDYTFGSEGEANRTSGLPLDVSKVRRIWPCQGGEGHFMARLVKVGTPRVLPAEGEYTAEEQLWLAAAEAAGKRLRGRAASLPRPRMPAVPAARMPVPAGKRCRVKSAAAKHRQGRQVLPRALQHGTRLPGSISRRWLTARLWCTAAVCCCRCRSADEPACAAGGRICGQRAERPLCTGAPSVHGIWRTVRKPRRTHP